MQENSERVVSFLNSIIQKDVSTKALSHDSLD